jgi:hypothetical protein
MQRLRSAGSGVPALPVLPRKFVNGIIPKNSGGQRSALFLSVVSVNDAIPDFSGIYWV